MDQYKISIIIPVYNQEKLLSRCINSVIDQTHKNLQVILVNDGSKDNSLSICQKYAESDKRIVVINKENGGVSSARNEGLKVANGDYYGFIDSDDYIHSDMFKYLLIAAIKDDADITECGFAKIDENQQIIQKTPLVDCVLQSNYECIEKYLLNQNTTNFNCNKLYKSNLFDSLEYSSFKYSEDYLVNVSAHLKCTKKVTISGCYYYYYMNDESACNSEFCIDKLDAIYAGEAAHGLLEGDFEELRPLVGMFIARYCMQFYANSKYIADRKERQELRNISKRIFSKYYNCKNSAVVRNARKYENQILTMVAFNLCPLIYVILLKIIKR